MHGLDMPCMAQTHLLRVLGRLVRKKRLNPQANFFINFSVPEQQFGNCIVRVGVEKRHRYLQHLSQLAHRQQVWFVDAQFIAIDARAGHECIDSRLNPQHLLRQPRSQAGLFEPRAPLLIRVGHLAPLKGYESRSYALFSIL